MRRSASKPVSESRCSRCSAESTRRVMRSCTCTIRSHVSAARGAAPGRPPASRGTPRASASSVDGTGPSSPSRRPGTGAQACRKGRGGAAPTAAGRRRRPARPMLATSATAAAVRGTRSPMPSSEPSSRPRRPAAGRGRRPPTRCPTRSSVAAPVDVRSGMRTSACTVPSAPAVAVPRTSSLPCSWMVTSSPGRKPDAASVTVPPAATSRARRPPRPSAGPGTAGSGLPGGRGGAGVGRGVPVGGRRRCPPGVADGGAASRTARARAAGRDGLAVLAGGPGEAVLLELVGVRDAGAVAGAYSSRPSIVSPQATSSVRRTTVSPGCEGRLVLAGRRPGGGQADRVRGGAGDDLDDQPAGAAAGPVGDARVGPGGVVDRGGGRGRGDGAEEKEDEVGDEDAGHGGPRSVWPTLPVLDGAALDAC